MFPISGLTEIDCRHETNNYIAQILRNVNTHFRANCGRRIGLKGYKKCRRLNLNLIHDTTQNRIMNKSFIKSLNSVNVVLRIIIDNCDTALICPKRASSLRFIKLTSYQQHGD